MEAAELLKELLDGAESTSVAQYGPAGNIFLRPMHFPDVGSLIVGHKHAYDHVTILIRGAMHARCFDGEPDHPVMVAEKDFRAPAYLLIRANRWHEFIAIEPETHAVCVFALRDRDGKVTEDRLLDWDLAATE